MRTFAFLLFFQSFASCQQAPDINLATEAAIASTPNAAAWKDPNKPLPATSGIVFRSADGGKTWHDASTGLPKRLSAQEIFAINGQVFLTSNDGVLYRSSSDPIAPVWEKDVLLREKVAGLFPGRAGVLACSYYDGFFQEILPGVWKPVHTDLKDKMLRTILETKDGNVFVGCDYGIFKSTDNGKTWKRVFNEGMVLSIIESDKTMIAGGSRGLLRSTDGGENWNWALTEGGVGIATAAIEGKIAAITYNTDSKTRRLRTSSDGGKTWVPIDEGLSPSDSMSNITQVGEHLFCSHPTGIFRSSDEGKTWELMLPSPKEKMYNFVVSGRVIYAIATGFGC
ncbi:MAG: WD40/YVTN/BNR-like repeat-containing protein [Saprospiraceae bacterium]